MYRNFELPIWQISNPIEIAAEFRNCHTFGIHIPWTGLVSAASCGDMPDYAQVLGSRPFPQRVDRIQEGIRPGKVLITCPGG